jgi:hypothetical protein
MNPEKHRNLETAIASALLCTSVCKRVIIVGECVLAMFKLKIKAYIKPSQNLKNKTLFKL